ncbi:hypothetical protein SAICODRAFT_21871 [Saitoella complicata NRRL Y-17804]|uniref:RanBD1 domain-containing protein n=1 Tax=Saitoella complicata (strain BCRC 22490 / CBS 7301 / JCM 7358 / NBRC 10748 / NRRL Y-17804) TaxID=698492 RepID=A0A0E9NJC8_SAICN|nr:uncharacterized protein SAICODRAFT_21871 [Saitoella complicata NRRL Y-17804]ODQ50124.1 hypothetical protein SAICODRAFT_21871 [Saitoella complicata NRRL Y-17804]GAO49903.1 hypothetical protein G7K_4039-t1 [Saitoella complicata NRRL Y-17804]
MSKRGAKSQLTQLNVGHGGDDSDDDTPDVPQVASEAQMARRKIALPKSRRMAGAPSAPTPVANPFAAVPQPAAPAPAAANPFAALNTAVPAPAAPAASNAFSILNPAPSSSGEPKANPFANLQTTTLAASAPPVLASPVQENTNTQTAELTGEDKEEYERLLKLRSVNYAFLEAIKKSYENDPFGDLRNVGFEAYGRFYDEAVVKKGSDFASRLGGFSSQPAPEEKKAASTFSFGGPTEAPKASSFSFGIRGSSPEEGQEEEAPKPAASGFSFGMPQAQEEKKEESKPAAAPVFTFNPPSKNDDKPISGFTFGAPVQKKDENKSAVPGGFTFGAPAPAEKEVDDEDKPESVSSGFGFSPVQSEQSEEMAKPVTPSFGFGAAVEKKEEVVPKPSAAPVFSFGVSSDEAEKKKDEDKPAVSAFGGSAFGGFGAAAQAEEKKVDTTPLFAFGAPAATEKKEEEKETPAVAPAATAVFSFGAAPSTPAKPAAASPASFAWTPDRGIKFGSPSAAGGVENKDEKPSTTPVFGFSNPLASPTTSSFGAAPGASDAEKKPAPASTGFGFGFGAGTGAASVPSFGSKTSFGTTSFGGSSFGASSFGSAAPAPAAGATTAPVFSFSAPTPAPAAATAEAAKEGEEEDAPISAEARTNDELVDGKGEGEENEDTVHSVRGKIFKKNDEGGWSEIGVGLIKINVDKETNKARVLGRIQGSGKLIINVRLQARLPYTLLNKTNIQVPSPIEGGVVESYLIRVKAENAEPLLEAMKEHKGSE